ncbi:MAG: DUF6057 family protein [Bacteroidales bacterium]
MQKNQIAIFVKWLLVLFFLGFVYFHFVSMVQPMLMYHLQQPPFYRMNVFLAQYTDYPGGMAEYAGNFLAQLLHTNVSGSVLLVCSVLTLMLLAKYIFSQTPAGGKGFLWMMLPTIPLILLFQNYYFPYFVFLKILLGFLGVALFVALRNYRFVQLVFLVLWIVGSYYVAGATALLIFLSGILLFSIFAPSYNLLLRFVHVVIGIVAAVAVPYLGYKYFFNIPQEKIWWDLVPSQPVVIRYVPDQTLYLMVGILPATLLVMGLVAATKSLIQKLTFIQAWGNRLASYKWVITYFNIIIIAAGVYFVMQQWVLTRLDTQKKSVILVDYYTLHGEWDKAVNAALEAKGYDLFINYNYNRAVYNLGKAGDWFFRYPQLLGADALFPDKIASGQVALVASDFYYELGYISEALHWAYEAQSTTPYNPRVLKRLVQVHLIERRPEAAATYLNILKTAYFQDEFVKKYSAYLRDTSLISKDPEFQQKRALMPLNTYTPGTINQKFKLLLQFNGNNRQALEFLAISYLLSHQLGDFVKIIPQIAGYYKQLPKIYQEALLLFMAKTNVDVRYPFDEEIVQSLRQFFEYLKKYPDRKIAKNTLAQYYKGTYVYYVTFESPLVTKMQLKAKEVEPY